MAAIIAGFAPTQEKKVDENSRKTSRLRKLECGVTRQVRVGFDFTPMPEFIEREIEKPALEKLYRILMRYARRGIFDPPMRVLAKAMGRVDRTVQRYLRELEKLGKLIIELRRITKNRNATNVYILAELQGGVGDKNVTEKLRAELKTTTTPAPEARVEVSQPDDCKTELRKFWEARFTQDRQDSTWRRKLYERKTAFLEVVKGWRQEKNHAAVSKINATIAGEGSWFAEAMEVSGMPLFGPEMKAFMERHGRDFSKESGEVSNG